MSNQKSLAEKITDYESQDSIGSRLRARRIAPLLALIEKVSREQGSVRIIDIGGTEQYWGIVPRQYLLDQNVEITIVNIPGTRLPANHGPFVFTHADGCDLAEFEDNSFDIAHSNSVVEHVGDWSRMVQFSRELGRVAPKYFVQTPNYWFPIEPHCMTPFFHWLPKATRIWLVMKFSLGHWHRASSVGEAVETVESARLLNRKMFSALFGDAQILTERIAFMPKSFIAVRD